MEPECCLLFSPLLFIILKTALPTVLGFVTLLLLLFCSALISGSEIALFSLTPNDKKELAEDNIPNSQTILNLLERPRQLLATILIGNTLVNVAIIFIATFLIEPLLTIWAEEGSWLNKLINLAGVTTLLVLFGEIAPKVYASSYNIQLSKFMARPLNVLSTILYFPSVILVSSGKLIERLLQKRVSQHASKEDIDEAIDLTVSKDEDASTEADILKSIVKFGEVSAKQVMKPRVDVEVVDLNMTFKEVVELIKKSGYSRLPAVDNDFDNVVGMLYAKDLIGDLHQDEDFEWQALIRPEVLFIPEAKKIDDLLKEFQQNRKHIAIVVDEYGGSAGIITLEDILEEIIGEIRDEFDDTPDFEYKKIDDFTYQFEGKTLINDVVRILGIDNDTFDQVRGSADSLAGLILEITGNFPKMNQVITYDAYKFKITKLSKRRIEYVTVFLPQEE